MSCQRCSYYTTKRLICPLTVPKSILCALVVGLLGSCGNSNLLSSLSLLLKLHRLPLATPTAKIMSNEQTTAQAQNTKVKSKQLAAHPCTLSREVVVVIIVSHHKCRHIMMGHLKLDQFMHDAHTVTGKHTNRLLDALLLY